MAPIAHTEDYYAILKVKFNASPEEITKAYRTLALQQHPDKNHAPGATEAFQLLNLAHEVLKDAVQRQKYDRADYPRINPSAAKENGPKQQPPKQQPRTPWPSPQKAKKNKHQNTDFNWKEQTKKAQEEFAKKQEDFARKYHHNFESSRPQGQEQYPNFTNAKPNEAPKFNAYQGFDGKMHFDATLTETMKSRCNTELRNQVEAVRSNYRQAVEIFQQQCLDVPNPGDKPVRLAAWRKSGIYSAVIGRGLDLWASQREACFSKAFPEFMYSRFGGIRALPDHWETYWQSLLDGFRPTQKDLNGVSFDEAAKKLEQLQKEFKAAVEREGILGGEESARLWGLLGSTMGKETLKNRREELDDMFELDNELRALWLARKKKKGWGSWNFSQSPPFWS